MSEAMTTKADELLALRDKWIANLPWSASATEHEKALVIGNLRSFAEHIRETLIESHKAEVERLTRERDGLLGANCRHCGCPRHTCDTYRNTPAVACCHACDHGNPRAESAESALAAERKRGGELEAKAQAFIDLFVWEPSEETGEVTPHLDRAFPDFAVTLTNLRAALAGKDAQATDDQQRGKP